MKYLMLALSLLSFSALAEEVPSYMKDGVITVTLKDGKTYKFSTNDFKVVKREAAKAVTEVETTKTTAKPKEVKSNKNRITLVLGRGYSGSLKTSSNSSTVEVEQEKGLLGGVVLQTDLNENYHLMGGALTNQTFIIGVGRGF